MSGWILIGQGETHLNSPLSPVHTVNKAAQMQKNSNYNFVFLVVTHVTQINDELFTQNLLDRQSLRRLPKRRRKK